ncbi:MAG: TlpA family protein disulfide reductase [Xanthomonadales bacterium]|nr:TlpA family protein disulfide reductase [Xanthomonadales bacterium]
MNSLGPFPITAVVVALSLLAGWLLVRVWARRLPESPHRIAGARFLDAALVGLLVARLGFVLRWWPEYAAAPMSIIAIGDGGFLWWVGLPAAVAFACWRTAGARPLRKPILAGIAAGMLAWLTLTGTLALLQRSAPPLPDLKLIKLDGSPIRLDVYAAQPIVLNLWATWCPPCRREMPVLEDAQQRYPGVAFVLVNQGEGREEIHAFLQQQGLALDHILLDRHSQTMRDTGARALPTTLFFDAGGRLVDSHMGELTRASLASTLRKRFGIAAEASSAGAGQ